MKDGWIIQRKSFHIDLYLLFICLSLLVIGYIMVVSSSLHLGEKLANNKLHYPVRQLVHIVIGIVAAFFVTQVSLKTWEKMGSWLFIIGIILLMIVLIPGAGVKVNGATRWLSLGGFRVQVSEIVKFFSVIYMAGYATRHKESIQGSTYGLARALIPFSVACFFLMLEPDFGSSVIILVIAMGVMFLSGARLGQFTVLIIIVAISAMLLIYFSPYRWNRVTIFIDPWLDAQGKGFQLVHALMSFGRGEIFGVGLGSGIQKLSYLPEAHTDFLFSVLAEELGLVGVLLVIGLFTLLLLHVFSIALKAEKAGEMFSAYVAYGSGIWLGFQSIINMGVNMGVLPTKGLTLPLMSYGGGSMITMCSVMALLFRIQSEVTEKEKGLGKGR
ncbi:MAG: putative lipid II flippase FtsW [Methylococcales bacterium]|nr:putative lipid II flippase FtsW [Methylococcales bacterium]